MKSGVYVRARTSDNRWATVDAADLTDESFKIFVLKKLADAGAVASLGSDNAEWVTELQTNLTKVETEYE
jgi:hypothetical protein